jgi:hypothetical protein
VPLLTFICYTRWRKFAGNQADAQLPSLSLSGTKHAFFRPYTSRFRFSSQALSTCNSYDWKQQTHRLESKETARVGHHLCSRYNPPESTLTLAILEILKRRDRRRPWSWKRNAMFSALQRLWLRTHLRRRPPSRGTKRPVFSGQRTNRTTYEGRQDCATKSCEQSPFARNREICGKRAESVSSGWIP